MAEDMPQDILRFDLFDPDAALREAMAAKENSRPANLEAKFLKNVTSRLQTDNPILNEVVTDNVSESNFSCQSGQMEANQQSQPSSFNLNQVNRDDNIDNMPNGNFSCQTQNFSQPEPIFKLPPKPVDYHYHQRKKKQVLMETQSACQEIEKHIPAKAEIYYNFIMKKLSSIRHFVMSAHDPSMNELFMQTSMMNSTINCNLSVRGSQKGGEFSFARPANPAQSQLNPVVVLKRSSEQPPIPVAKSSPLKESVKTSPITQNLTMNKIMNSTMNSTVNRTTSQGRVSEDNTITLKNWTLILGKKIASDEHELLIRGLIAKKCEFGNTNMELTTPSIKSRLGEFCIKTKDGRTYELQGTFQNPNNSVPRMVTSLYLKRGSGIPVHWRKMAKFWGSVRPAGKRPANEERSKMLEDDSYNAGESRMKSDAKITKRASPVKRPTSKPSRPSVSRQSVTLKHTLSRPSVKPIIKIARIPVQVSKPLKPDPHKMPRKHKEHLYAEQVQSSSAIDSSENSPVEARGKKRRHHHPPKPSPGYLADRSSGTSTSHSIAVLRPKVKSRQQPQLVEESSLNSSVEVSQAKRKRKTSPKYSDENDGSLLETERSKSNFADNSNVSYQIVSPGKTLNNIKKMKDSNIINSQVTPPTSYFLNVLPNSEKKSEEMERTKKPVKRLNERVLKKGRTSANSQNIGPKLMLQDPKGLKKYIQESNARLTKIQSSRSMSQDEMSVYSDGSMGDFLDD
nr:PREDICTED: uncharacterized protein LOC109031025 isoform X2 [Bemisia tabaci]